MRTGDTLIESLVGQRVRLLGWDGGAKPDFSKSGHDVLLALLDSDDLSGLEPDGVLGLHYAGEDHFFGIYTDPTDGYRSNLGDVVPCDRPDECVMSLEGLEVYVVLSSEDTPREEKWAFTDLDGHVWFSFGTRSLDDWYPSAFTDWEPKELKW